MTFTRSVLFVVVSLVCFLIALLLSVDIISGSNTAAWGYAGLASFAAAHLP